MGVALNKGTVLVPSFSETTLANNELEMSSEITNSELYPLADIRIDIDTGGTMTIGEILALVYLIREVDGVYEQVVENTSGGTGYAPPESLIGDCRAISIADPAGVLSFIIRRVELPPDNFKMAIKNVSGTEWDAAVAMDIIPYQEQDDA